MTTQADSLRAAQLHIDCDPASCPVAHLAAATPPTEGLDARLREFLVLRPVGTVGPDKVPWFQHCGISHAEGAECVVCAALAATPPTEGLDRRLSDCEDALSTVEAAYDALAAAPPAEGDGRDPVWVDDEFDRTATPPAECGCTVDAELGAGPVCPACGHRDHGRSGCEEPA